ncbi:unnamed protein product, partial [Polarella glacialis]
HNGSSRVSASRPALHRQRRRFAGRARVRRLCVSRRGRGADDRAAGCGLVQRPAAGQR